MAKKTVLLTGCGGIPTLNVLRCLRHEGDDYRIIGVDCDQYHIFLTRGYERKYLVPRADQPRYIEELNRIIDKEGVEFLHAQPDVEVAALSARREDIRTTMFLPSKDVVKLCHNKYALISALHEAGVPCARSFLIRSEADLEEAFEVLGGDGRKVWLRIIRGAGGRGALPVERMEHAKMWIEYWKGWGIFTAEEYLPGRNLAWQGVFKEGKLIGSIAWERIRYIIRHVAPSGITGTPSVARLIDDDEVHRIGQQAIRAISPKPNGVFGVDLKENREGTPCITEINPGRFFTPSYMYAKAGYNLVKMYFDMALGRELAGYEQRPKISRNMYWIRGIDAIPILVRIDKPPKIGMELSTPGS